MKDYFVSYARSILGNWQDVTWGCIVVVSAIIFIVGLFKKPLFNKIPNKLVRKVVLSFVSIILVIPATCIMCVADGQGFEYYWAIVLQNSVATIVTYWLYENTLFRNLISYIGKKAVARFGGVIVDCFHFKNNKKAVKLLQVENDELKEDVMAELENSDIKGQLNGTQDDPTDLSNL